MDVEALGVDLLSLSGPQVWRSQGHRRAVDSSAARASRRCSPAVGTSATAARAPRTSPRWSASASPPSRPGRDLVAHQRDVGRLRDRLEAGILQRVAGTVVNGDPSRRVHNTTNISFERVEAESLLIALDLEGIAVSTGSACSSGTLEPSHVLKAMRLPPGRTQGALRFSLGPTNTEAEVDHVLQVLPGLVEKLRSLTRMPVSR